MQWKTFDSYSEQFVSNRVLTFDVRYPCTINEQQCYYFFFLCRIDTIYYNVCIYHYHGFQTNCLIDRSVSQLTDVCPTSGQQPIPSFGYDVYKLYWNRLQIM